MPLKRSLTPIEPHKQRTIPRSFGWIDHRLRSSRILSRLRAEDIALYMFLVLAADSQGLSCWRLDRVERELPFEHARLCDARRRLVKLNLIAYRPWSSHARDGVYQVLPVPAARPWQEEMAAALLQIGRPVD